MDKNTIIGFVLIGLLFIGFSIYTQPSAEEQRAMYVKDSTEQAQRAQAEQKAQLAAQQAAAKQKQQQLADTTALFHSVRSGKATQVVLRNKKLVVTLSSKGATVTQAQILGYKDALNGADHVNLFRQGQQQLNFALTTAHSVVSTQDLYFTPTAQTDSSVTFVAEAAKGQHVSITYTLGANYLLHASLRAEGMAQQFAPGTQTMDVLWRDKAPQQEKGFNFENRYTTLTYHHTDGGTDHLSEASEVKDEDIEKAVDWIAFKNQFFAAVMIAKQDFAAHSQFSSIPQAKGSGYLKEFTARTKAFFDPTGRTATEFEFYYGPNDFRILQQVENQSHFGKELEMQRLVYLGWPLFRYINRWFTLYVFDWLSQWFSMGVVLILITLLLKAITYPMVKKSYMSSAKMRVLKPKLDAATAQYNKPEDQMKKQQAMMAEYAKHGVSPLSGCLPMLIQAPIWIAMFNFVPNAIQLRGQGFLWMQDLSTYDPIWEWGHDLWLIGDHLSLTCILFCGAQLLYSWITMQQQKDQMVGQQAEQMKMMQWMMMFMPLLFFFMFNDYSSGLNFYYFVSLFFSAAIMFILRKTTNDQKLLEILEARYKENQANPNKNKGLMARMQALQQMQEQQMKQMQQRRQADNKK